MEPGSEFIPFITYSDQEGYQITPQANSIFTSISEKIAIISISGQPKTGKTYLLNAFLKSSTALNRTKGLWISKHSTIKTSDGENAMLFLIDSEGLESISENQNHNTNIFLLCSLLSSLFIFNSMGSLEDNLLNSMSSIINLTKYLQVRSFDSELDVVELSYYFPSLLWVLRDFNSLIADPSGKMIGTKDYLELALAAQKGSSDNIELKNRIRKLLKHIFLDRDCFALIKPFDEENTDCVRPEFAKMTEQMKKMIFKKVKVKKFKGKPVSGKMFLGLAKGFTDALNRKKMVVLEEIWRGLCVSECFKDINELVEEYDKEVRKDLKDGPVALVKLRTVHKELKFKYRKELSERSLIEDPCEYIKLLSNGLSERFKAVKLENDLKLLENFEEQWKGFVSDMRRRVMTEEFFDFQKFRKEFEARIAELKSSMPMSNSVEDKIKEASSEFLAETAELISNNAVTMHMKATEKLNNELEQVKYSLSSKKEEMVQEKNLILNEIKEAELESFQLRAKIATIEGKIELEKNEKEEIEAKSHENISKISDELMGQSNEFKQKFEESNQLYQNLLIKYSTDSSNLKKDILLSKQEIQWKNKEISKLKNEELEKENNITQTRVKILETRTRIDSLDEVLIQIQSEIKAKESTLDWRSEKILLQTQSESLKTQLEDIKSMQETLKSLLNSKPEKKSEAKDPTKLLSSALEQKEQKCEKLESKVDQLGFYQKIIKSSAAVQCSECSKQFTPDSFLAHLTSCQDQDKESYSINVKRISLREESDDPYMEFEISVASRSRTWTVFRRLIHFAVLNSSVQKEFPDLNIPEVFGYFPAQSGLFSTKSGLTIEDRRKLSQNYLTGLANVSCVKISDFFKRFIEVDGNR